MNRSESPIAVPVNEERCHLDVPYFLCDNQTGDLFGDSDRLLIHTATPPPMAALAAGFDSVLASARTFSCPPGAQRLRGEHGTGC